MSISNYPTTIAALPFFVAGRFQKPDLLGRVVNGQVVPMAGRELVDRVRDLGLGLTALGMETGDRVALLAESRPEWLVADFAVLTAGAVTVPIYPTLAADQVRYILLETAAKIAVVSTLSQLEKLAAVVARLPQLERIVLIEAVPNATCGHVPVVSLAEVAAIGHRRLLDAWGVARQFLERAKQVRPDDLATIIYTSGTTADPKGVMLTHANLVANLCGCLEVLDLREEDTALSFLPLCHAFERTVAYILLTSGVSMIFAESLDTVARDLLIVRPTVMSGVPRVFEKLHARILEKGQATTTGIRRAMFNWAMGVAARRGAVRSVGEPVPASLQLAYRIANRLVFAKVRDGLGGRLRYAVSGSAPLNPAIARFFLGLDLPILEGYGLTETAPVLSVMPLGRERFGTVGPPLPNVEVRIAEDGEILVRGPNVMSGYYKRPDESAAALADGWFHTGDIGRFDEGGYLQITDRKKELIVTSGGKKIAPQPIEERLRTDPLVAEVMLVGDRRHFPAALIAPDLKQLGAQLKLNESEVRARLTDATVVALYQRAVDEVNRDLANFERIKRFALVHIDFSVATGELTPTLKIKRRVVEEKFRETIEELYR